MVLVEHELKNIYVGTTPVKKIYVGTQQVRPALPIPSSGLLGYRPLQSDLKDASGNGKDGSWFSGTGTLGTVGGKTGAIVTRDSYDKSTQHIVTTLNYSGPTVTICGWIYYNNLTTRDGTWHGILTNCIAYNNHITLADRPGQSNRWSVGGNGNIITSTTSATSGTWYFLCGVLTSSGKKIYLNGTQIASDSTGFTTGQGSIWRLGCGQIPNNTKPSDFFGGTDGYVRQCAVYNRELTATEVLQFYNQTA